MQGPKDLLAVGSGQEMRIEANRGGTPFLNAKSSGEGSNLEHEELSLGHFYFEVELPSKDILVGMQIRNSGKTSGLQTQMLTTTINLNQEVSVISLQQIT